MSFNIDNVLKEMCAVITEDTRKAGKDITKEIERILDNHKNSLADLALNRLNGNLTEKEFQEELEIEEKVLRIELKTIEIMKDAAMQKVINDAFSVFHNAVRAAL